VGQGAIHQVAGGLVKAFAHQRSYRAQHRPANPDHGFNPGVARRLLQQDDSAKKRNEHGRAHFQTETFGRNQVAAFVNEQQKNKSNRKPKAPKNGVHPNGQDHGAAGFEYYPAVLEGDDQGKLELGEKRDNGDTDWSQCLLQLLAETGPLRRRRCRAILGIYVLIHASSLPEFLRPASPFTSIAFHSHRLRMDKCLQRMHLPAFHTTDAAKGDAAMRANPVRCEHVQRMAAAAANPKVSRRGRFPASRTGEA
jgi:hypothetical protein